MALGSSRAPSLNPSRRQSDAVAPPTPALDAELPRVSDSLVSPWPERNSMLGPVTETTEMEGWVGAIEDIRPPTQSLDRVTPPPVAKPFERAERGAGRRSRKMKFEVEEDVDMEDAAAEQEDR